jgi:hypothetical protein
MMILAALVGVVVASLWYPYFWLVARYKDTFAGRIMSNGRFGIVPGAIYLYGLFLILQAFGMEDTGQKEAGFIAYVFTSLVGLAIAFTRGDGKPKRTAKGSQKPRAARQRSGHK